jgi:signal transduction histidine kinase
MATDVETLMNRLAQASAALRAASSAEGVRAEIDLATRDIEAMVGGAAAAVARTHLTAVGELGLEAARLREQGPEALRTRETLLAGVSHDLRNPLNTFAMSAGLLRDDLERNDVDVTRDLGLVHRMERAIERMQRMIEDLLEASRLDAKRITLSPKAINAADLVRDAVDAAKAAAAEKRASIVVEELEDATVNVDRQRALQLLGKVLGYALKTTSDGGTVRVAAHRVGDSVAISARAFTSGDVPVRTTETEGTGGLAMLIARALTEAHGGAFHFATREGVSIELTLPVAS